ncbi:hypothetical protein N9Y42_02985 [Mariniblastus sp.]|nr:hypothetical protein [Mariniblastus sp.]
MHVTPVIIFFAVWLCVSPLQAVIQSDSRNAPPNTSLWSPNRSNEVRLTPTANQILEVTPPLNSPTQSSADDQISLVLNETTLTEAIDQLKIETGLDIRLGDAKLALKTINIRIKRKRIDEILEILASQVGGYSEFDQARSIYYLYSGERKKEPDHKALERQINEAFPDSFVKLSKIGDQLLVRGQAKDFIEANQILKLIASFMPDGGESETATSQTNQLLNVTGGRQPGFDPLIGNINSFSTRDQTSRVINLLSVPGSQQVMLRVTVAEVNRSAARNIGLNFLVRNGEDNLFRSVIGTTSDGDGFLGEGLSGGTIQALIDSSDVGLAIDALRDLQLAKTLSEPNLTTIHGQRAEFRAGGRFPIPVISGLNNAGTQGVEFVPFGVSLDFVPFILERDRIRLVMRAEVSSRNEAIGSSIGGDGGTSVTGLDTREFSTTVELKPGQTLAVAGLIQDSLTSNARRIPGFEDIPLIGRAAASDSVTSSETELVILVTPEFVHPISNNERLPLPGHQVFEPNDYEFFVNGFIESQYSENYRAAARTDVFRRKAYYECERRMIVGDSGYSNYCPAASSPQSSVNVIGR